MKSEWMLVAAVIAFPLVTFFLFKLKSCYYPALFFAIKAAADRLVYFERVRDEVAFQLYVIAVLLIFLVIKNKGKIQIRGNLFNRLIPVILLYLVIFSVVGVIHGHNIVQILVDCYKYLDIIVFYVFFRAAWKDNDDVFYGIKALSVLMFVAGVIEVFITTRGGVGLNLIMSLFPIVMILSLYRFIRFSRFILIASLLIVAVCQTRTYIISFLLGLIALLLFLPKGKRDSILTFSSLFLAIAAIVIGIFGGGFISSTLERFVQLSSGFEESGGYRIYDYLEAIHCFLNHPVFGNGLGYLKRTYIQKMGWMDWGGFVHCLYLEILFKVGITGTICFATFAVSFVAPIWKTIKTFKNKNNFMFAVCSGGICSFIIWIIAYTFAPLSTIGSMFMGPTIACIAISNYESELDTGLGTQNVQKNVAR